MQNGMLFQRINHKILEVTNLNLWEGLARVIVVDLFEHRIIVDSFPSTIS